MCVVFICVCGVWVEGEGLKWGEKGKRWVGRVWARDLCVVLKGWMVCCKKKGMHAFSYIAVGGRNVCLCLFVVC